MPHHRILGDPNGDPSLELSSVVRIHGAEALPDERSKVATLVRGHRRTYHVHVVARHLTHRSAARRATGETPSRHAQSASFAPSPSSSRPGVRALVAEPKPRDPDLWRFAAARAASPGAERRAQQLIAVSFYAIAIYIAVDAVRALATGEHPHVSSVGIGLSAVTLATVPPLAIAKARVAEALGSSATKSESRQTMLCAYLSAAPLVGLGLNAIAGWWWADPITALIIAAVAVKEGRSSWRGESCCTAPVACAADTPACEDECCSPAATASRCAAGLPHADGASRSIDGAFATTRRASLGRRYASPSPGPAQPSGRAETALASA